MTVYHFITIWKYKAPLETIWPIILDVENWPSWWKGVRSVEILERGDAHGIGARQRFVWRSQLPYQLVFEAKVTGIIPLQKIEGEAVGDLQGIGIWTMSQEGAITRMEYHWNVCTTRMWMNTFSVIAKPIFIWNHNLLMRWGGEGLAALLHTPLLT